MGNTQDKTVCCQRLIKKRVKGRVHSKDGREKPMTGAGVAKWLKAQGLGPCHVGVRGFDSRLPHKTTRVVQSGSQMSAVTLVLLFVSNINRFARQG